MVDDNSIFFFLREKKNLELIFNLLFKDLNIEYLRSKIKNYFYSENKRISARYYFVKLKYEGQLELSFDW